MNINNILKLKSFNLYIIHFLFFLPLSTLVEISSEIEVIIGNFFHVPYFSFLLFAISAGLTRPLGVYIAKKFGFQFCLKLSTILYFFGILLVSIADIYKDSNLINFPIIFLYSGRIIQGISFFCLPVLSFLLNETTNENNRISVNTKFSLFGSIGFGAGSFILALSPGSYMIILALILIIIYFFIHFLDFEHYIQQEIDFFKNKDYSFLNTFKNLNLMTKFIIIGFGFAFFQGFYYLRVKEFELGEYHNSLLNRHPMQAFILISTISALLIRLLGGYIIDKIDNLLILLCSSFLAIISLGFLIGSKVLFPFNGFIYMSIFFGFSRAFVNGSLNSWISSTYSNEERFKAISLFYLFSEISIGLGFIFYGFLKGKDSTYAYTFLAGVFSFIILYLLILLTKKNKKASYGI